MATNTSFRKRFEGRENEIRQYVSKQSDIYTAMRYFGVNDSVHWRKYLEEINARPGTATPVAHGFSLDALADKLIARITESQNRLAEVDTVLSQKDMEIQLLKRENKQLRERIAQQDTDKIRELLAVCGDAEPKRYEFDRDLMEVPVEG